MTEPVDRVVEAHGLTKRFGDVLAVNGLDLAVSAGTIHGLVGPNGAGKSTLLSLLFGLTRPDAGALRVFGRSPADPRFLDPIAGFLEPRFYPYLSGRQNLEVLAELDRGSAADRIDDALELVGLRDRADDRCGGYSLGMRRRLGIAAALTREPRLLMLDEPANGLDPAGMRDMRSLLVSLAREGMTVLLSSHNMTEVEDLCGAVTIMRAGEVAFDGSIEDMRAKAPDPGFRLRTSDDTAAAALANGDRDIAIDRDGRDGLIVRARQEKLDEYVIGLGRAGIAVRRLDLELRPLESLFFSLTEPEERP